MSCVAKNACKMPFHPPQETLNRIDAIRKKFEGNGEKPEKPAVKRTPAFRCDRIVCGKNVTNVGTKNKSAWTIVQSDSESKISPPVVKLKKSYSDNSVQSIALKHEYKVKFISHEKDLLRIDPVIPQYAVVHKKKDTPDLNDPIRLALQSPLPAGPPPKKPPRIFTHTPAKEANKDARLKLEKLEHFILKHEKNGHVIVPRRGEDALKKCDLKISAKKCDELGNDQCGFGRLSCLTECVVDDGNVYLMNVETKSEGIDKCVRGNESSSPKNPAIGADSVKSREPIYAQPYLHKVSESASNSGAAFQTFGKLSPTHPCTPPLPAMLSKTDQPLHYMCTDLAKSQDWPIETIDKSASKCRSSTKIINEQLSSVPSRSHSTPAIRTSSSSVLTTFSNGNSSSMQIASTTASSNSACLSSQSLTDASSIPNAVGSIGQSLLLTTLSSISPLKPTRAAPIAPSGLSTSPPKRAEMIRRTHNSDVLPERKTSSNCSSPPNVSPSGSPLGDVRRLMDKAFGLDTYSWDSDASGRDSSEDPPSLEFVHCSKNSESVSSSSSPSLNSISSQPDDETLSRLTAKRKVYVKRVSSHLLATDRLIALQTQRESHPNSHLFESCLLIGLTLTEGPNGKKKNLPYVKSFFPKHMTPPPLIEYLCFPDADAWPPPQNQNGVEAEQQYSIVLTNEKGERKFGYCRRVLPEGSEIPLPLAYCIISTHRATGFYYTVLEELESRHGTPELEMFIDQLYENEFPNPGQSLKLNNILEKAKLCSSLPKPDDLVPSTLVRRPVDVRLENRDVTQLFRYLNIPVFLKVLSSILLERKVLLLGNSLGTLSGCIEGLQSILSPFSWQHTYVPVLPAHMLGLCEAPTPYIIGVLKQPNLESTLSSQFSEGIMVDLEESRIISCCKDEGSILPNKLRKSLRSALTLATTAESAVNLPDSQKNVLVSEAFLRFFVEVCGHYERHIRTQSDGSRIFQKDAFIRAVNSSSIQSFLEWFVETALFHVFIKDRVEFDMHDLFWKRCVQQFGKTDSISKIRGGNKKVKSLGDRIKDLASFGK